MITLLLAGLFAQTPYSDYIGDPKPITKPAIPPPLGAAASPPPGQAAALPSRKACSENCRCDDCHCALCVCGMAQPKAVALDFKPEPKRTAPPDDRRWYPLSTHPGYYGFGRLNAAGQVVVERHRYGTQGYIQDGPVADPALAAPACANGQCPGPTYRRGPFGNR